MIICAADVQTPNVELYPKFTAPTAANVPTVQFVPDKVELPVTISLTTNLVDENIQVLNASVVVVLLPAIAKAAADVPDPLILDLAVIIALFADQAVPLNVSVILLIIS